MPEITIVIYDNGLHAQNQDYLPSRSILQKEFIQHLINKKFDEDAETVIGVIPVCQEQHNDILTPTKQKDYLYTFINKCGLTDNMDYIKPLTQSICAFKQRDISTKNLIFFVGSAINEEEEDEMFVKILEMLTLGISVTMICFGEALEYYNLIVQKIEYPNFRAIPVEVNDDYDNLYNLVTDSVENDPELAEAIRLSIEESKKNK